VEIRSYEMKKIKYLLVIFITMFLIDSVNAQAGMPLERRLGFGAEFGIIGGGPGGPYFGMAFSGDYLIGRNFSIAEIISFIPSGDLTQFNANTVARFNIPAEEVSLIPYMGVGFTYGSYSTDEASENSFSMSFPIGIAVTYLVAAQIEAVGRFQFTLTNLDYGPLGTHRNYSEIMVGFRFSPM
jgi:hypothetical protein